MSEHGRSIPLSRIASAFEKTADAARSKMVHDRRYEHGLEKETWEDVHKQHLNGKIVPDDKVIVGKGGNRALMDKDVLERTTKEMSEFAKEHPWQFWGTYPGVVGGAALAGAGAAAPAATGAALVRGAATAGNGLLRTGRFLKNPLYELGFPKWVGPASYATGLASTAGMAALPEDDVQKIPEGVRHGMADLMYFMPLHGAGTYLVGGALGATPDLWMSAARNAVDNLSSGRVPVPTSPFGRITRSAVGGVLDYAGDEARGVARDLENKWIDAASSAFGDEIDQVRQLARRTGQDAVSWLGDKANSGLEVTTPVLQDAAALLSNGSVKFDELPPEVRQVMISMAVKTIANQFSD